MALLTSKNRVYLNADRSKAVLDGHPEAQSLLVAQGAEIREEDAEKYPGALKLIKGGGKAVEEESTKPTAVAPDGPNVPVTPAASIAAVETKVKPDKATVRKVRVQQR